MMDHRAITAEQGRIADAARDLEERLKRLEPASALSRLRMAKAAEAAERASGALTRGQSKEAAALAPDLPTDNFRAEPIEAMSFHSCFADLVICSAVLHFARDDEQFQGMLRGAWRVLRGAIPELRPARPVRAGCPKSARSTPGDRRR